MKAGDVLIVLAMLGAAFAQTEQKIRQDLLVERARKGDDSALSEMERKGDVQGLQSLLHDPDYAGKFAVRLSLARMGDTQILQYFACRTLTSNLFEIQGLMQQDLDYIGGDFTIEIYRKLLDSDQRFLPELQKDHGDSVPRLPSTWALVKLPKLIPNSMIPDLSPLEFKQARKRAKSSRLDGGLG